MQKPSIGRIVIVFEPGNQTEYPAIITRCLGRDGELDAEGINATVFADLQERYVMHIPLFADREAAKTYRGTGDGSRRAVAFWPDRI